MKATLTYFWRKQQYCLSAPTSIVNKCSYK